ncbi:MAG: DUF3526 domain-containing protein [Bacteroidota bacterium]
MWPIIKNEWRFLGRNRALLGISLGFLLVLTLSVFLGQLQSSKQGQSYETARHHLRQQWESIDAMNPHGAAHYGTYVFKPTNFLTSLDEGVNGVTGNVLRVEGHVQNEMVHSENSQMQFVSKFGKLKSALLLQYLLPLFLVFLAFHSMSSERQSGRLKMLALQGAPPASVATAKTLAIWLYGMGLLSLTILVYALVNTAHLSPELLQRTLFFYLAYALYYFIITGLTVMVSARGPGPTAALTTMLGLWILWTIFLPNLLMSSVERWYDLPSRNEFQVAMKEDRAKGIDGHNPVDQRSKALEQRILAQYEVDSLSQLPLNFDGLRMQADEEYGNQVWDKHFGALRTVMAQQRQSYQLAGIFNPFISLQNASKGFCASDNWHHQAFLLQVENYRRALIKKLNDEHAYGGSKTGDWGWEADNAFYRSIPDYEHQAPALASVFPNYRLDLLFLLAWTGLTLILLNWGGRKMQLL